MLTGSKSLYCISFQGHALCEMHEVFFPHGAQGRRVNKQYHVPVTELGFESVSRKCLALGQHPTE